MTSEPIERNHVLTEKQADDLRREAETFLRCPEESYKARGRAVLGALDALGWPTCRECLDGLAAARMDGVELCQDCLDQCEQEAWTGVLHDVVRELGPAGRRRLKDFLDEVVKFGRGQKAGVDPVEAIEFAFSAPGVVIDPETPAGELPRPYTVAAG